MIEINPQMRIDVFSVGTEHTPVIVIDDVLLDTSILRRYAAESVVFDSDQLTAYPGIRAPLPRIYTAMLMQVLGPLFRKTYAISEQLQPRPIMEYFSLLTTPVEELQRLQRVPHYDSTKDDYFALVHYLNPGDFGGTGFFRHQPTGYERMHESRLAKFYNSAQRFVEQHGEPESAYIKATTEHFELLLGVDYRPNRIVAYPGNLLHSGLVEPSIDISNSPEHGRLTANLFLEYS